MAVVSIPERKPVHHCGGPHVHNYPEGTVYACDVCGEHYTWERRNGATRPWWWRTNA